jgi:hypothetical protein
MPGDASAEQHAADGAGQRSRDGRVQRYRPLILQNRLAELSSQLEAAAIEVHSK